MAEYFFPKKVRIQHPANVFTWYGPGKQEVDDEILAHNKIFDFVGRRVPVDGKIKPASVPNPEDNQLAASLPVKPEDTAVQEAKEAQRQAEMLKPTKTTTK
jgi:hypothetical protein